MNAQEDYFEKSKALEREREALGRLIRQFITVHAEDHADGVIRYTTTISTRLLVESLNDREALVGCLAREIAHFLMRVVPIRQVR